MPTDLPPDYKPKPAADPANPADPSVPGAEPAFPPVPGEDSRDVPDGTPAGGNDVLDPPGWATPPTLPGEGPLGIPQPAGTPTF